MRQLSHLFFQPFPFVLAERSSGGLAYFEDSWKRGARGAYLIAICLSVPAAGLLFANLMWPRVAPLGKPNSRLPIPGELLILGALCVLVALAIIFARMQKRTAVFLLATPDDGLMLQRRGIGASKSDHQPIPRAQCELRIHPVRVQYLARPALCWDGYACVVHVGSELFALAVTKDRESCESVASHAPRWVPRLSEGDGELIETVGDMTVR